MIEDPPVLTVNRRLTRPAALLVERLRGAQTGHVVDALGGAGALAASIKPVPGATAAMLTLCGPALTCACAPGDHLGLVAALAEAKPGKLEGLVTDGAVRDVEGIIDVGRPVFCAGISPNSPAKTGLGTVGLPVTLGGVAIASGDVLVGDRNGVVVVPQARLAEVVEALDRVRALEDTVMKQVAEGLIYPERWKSLLRPERIRYIE